MHLTGRWLVLAALVVVVAGCSSGPDGRGEGPLLTSVGTANDHMAAEVQGRLGLRGDCLLLGGMPVVWPEGTQWNSGRRSLTLPNGIEVAVGASVTGGGGYLKLDAVKSAFGRAVADTAEPCLGETGEIAVFNPGSEVQVAS